MNKKNYFLFLILVSLTLFNLINVSADLLQVSTPDEVDYTFSGSISTPTTYAYDGNTATNVRNTCTDCYFRVYENITLPQNSDISSGSWDFWGGRFYLDGEGASVGRRCYNYTSSSWTEWNNVDILFLSLYSWNMEIPYGCLQGDKLMTDTNTTSFDSAGIFADNFYNITYNSYINILSPSPSQIFLQDSPTAELNISTGTDMDICYYDYGEYKECLQESSNETNQTGNDGDCFLNYTGNYQYAFETPFDGNYDTFASGSYAYVNYTKPMTAVGAKWQIKALGQSLTNYSIIDSCFSYDSEKILLRIRADAGSGDRGFDCFNGTWFDINSGGTSSASIYEEGIYWNVSNRETMNKLNSTYFHKDAGSNLLDGSHNVSFWCREDLNVTVQDAEDASECIGSFYDGLFPCSNAIDEDEDTFAGAERIIGTDAFILENFTIPIWAEGANWSMKYLNIGGDYYNITCKNSSGAWENFGDASETSFFYNHTIPDSCLSGDTLQTSVMVSYNGSDNSDQTYYYEGRVYWINEDSWHNSETVTFDVDSVNVTTCRDLTVSGREYELINDINLSSQELSYSPFLGYYCFDASLNNSIFEGNNNHIFGNSSSTVFGYYSSGNLNNMTIQNLEISDVSSGIYVNDNCAKDFYFSGLNIHNSLTGIDAQTSDLFNINIQNSNFTNITQYGVKVDNDEGANAENRCTGLGDTTDGVISGNIFDNSSWTQSFDSFGYFEFAGLMLDQSDGMNITNNIFRNHLGINSTAFDLRTESTLEVPMIISGNIFENNNFSIQLNNPDTGVIFKNNEIKSRAGEYDIAVGFYMSNGTEIINLTGFNDKALFLKESKEFYIGWFADFQVNDSEGGFLESSTVNFYDSSESLEKSASTNATGKIPTQSLLEYRYYDGLKEFLTPHKVNVTKTDYIINSSSYNLSLFENLNEVIILELDNPVPFVEITSPSNGLASNIISHNISINITADIPDLANITLKTYYQNGTLLYTNTSIIGGSSTFFNYTLTFPYGDFQYYAEACDNESRCNQTANQSIFIFEGLFSPVSLVMDKTKVGESSKLVSNLGGSLTDYSYCNFTVVHPNGEILINNLNGTRVGSQVTSSSFLVNKTGLYSYNLTCSDRFGETSTRSNSTNTTYSILISPQNYTFGAISSKTETNTFNISLFDNSIGNILYSINSDIQNSGNFTLTTSESSILLGSLDSETNQSMILVSINASENIGNGTYSGNVTFTNTTYGLSKVVNFEYGINPPSGKPTIYYYTGNVKCSSDTDNICSNLLNFQQGGSFNARYKFFNDGEFKISGCVPKISDDWSGISFYSFSKNSLELNPGTGEIVDLTIATTTTSSHFGEYKGFVYLECDSSNLLGDNVTTDPSNRPYLRLALDEKPIFTPTGGGGGGVVITQLKVIKVNQQNSTLDFSDLELAIIYARISEYLENSTIINDQQKEGIREVLKGNSIFLSPSDLDLYILASKDGDISEINMDEAFVTRYDLVQKAIFFEETEFRINPRNVDTYHFIFNKASRVWERPINGNRIISSCVVESGLFGCKITSDGTAIIFTEFKDLDFFVENFDGVVKFTSEDGQVEISNIRNLRVINISNISFITIIGAVIIIFSLLIYFRILSKKKIKKFFKSD